jgi:putative proteasome-type protease
VGRTDALSVTLRRRITEDDEYFRFVRERWADALREAWRNIDPPDWMAW